MTPCRFCTTETGRSSDCHSTCEKYLNWREEHEENRQKIKEAKRMESLVYKPDKPLAKCRWEKGYSPYKKKVFKGRK